MALTPRPNELYRDSKGDPYRILTLARHADTGETMVIYQALTGNYDISCRSLASFSGSKSGGSDDGKARPLFEIIPDPLSFSAATDEQAAKENEAQQKQAPAHDTKRTERDMDRLMDFLDADSYEKKLEILALMHEDITDDIINTIAVALDLEVEEGELEERYQSLKSCLLMLDRFECNRLR